MSKKAYTLLAAVLLLTMLALAGCSSNTGQNAGGQTTIKFMHLWPAGSSKQQNMIVDNIVKQYESTHKNVKIDVEVLDNEQYKNKMKVLASSNQLPDVGMTWAAGYMQPFVSGNLYAPLDNVLNSGNLKESFIKGTTEAFSMNGKTYGLPLELNITPIYYNKQIFKKYNLQVPTTYADFQTVVKTLAQHGVAPIALGNKDRWTGSLWFMYLASRIGGADLLNDATSGKQSFDNPALVTAASDIQSLVKDNAFIKGFNGLSDDEAKSAFENGQAAMYLNGTWDVPDFTTNTDVPQSFRNNVGYMKFPTVAGGKGDVNSWVGGPGVGLFVAQNSKVKTQAEDFAKFFVQQWGPQAVQKAGEIPATKVDVSKLQVSKMFSDVLNELNHATHLSLFADVQMDPSAAQTHLNLIQSLFGQQITPANFTKQQEDAIKSSK